MDSLEVDDEQHLYFLNVYICIFCNLNHNSHLKIHICVDIHMCIYTHTHTFLCAVKLHDWVVLGRGKHM